MSLLFQRVSGHAFEAGDRPFTGAGSNKTGRWPSAEAPSATWASPPVESPAAWLGFPSLKNWSGKRKSPYAAEKGISVILLEAWEEGSLDRLPSDLSIWQMVERGEGTVGSSSTETFSSWYDKYLTALRIHPCLQFSIKKLVYKGLLMQLLVFHECLQPWHTNFSTPY